MRRYPEDIKEVVLDGNSLTIENFIAVTRFGAKVSYTESCIENMKKSRAVVDEIVEKEEVVYGISTGFGEFSKVSICKGDNALLQENLIISHAVAVGNPYPTEVVRGIMLLRANAICIGNSGARPVLFTTLIEMLNKGVHPIIPEKGSLGASGDLAPLSHMVLPMLGKGEAEYKGEVMIGATAMETANIPVVNLAAKEGLALINGTQAMTSVGALAYYDTETAAKLADITMTMTLEALTGLVNAFDPRVHAIRPHPGQSLVAKNIRILSKGSEILKYSQKLRVQDAYALRCTPQVHGAVRDSLRYIKGVLETEMNSVTDNPLIFPEDKAIISAGNFHGEPVALVMDFLGIAASEIAGISERRMERLVNPALSEGLPAFLTKHGGLSSGFMICQYSAASMVSENKVFAHPASVDSIPSSANQEDHVSMGTTAARKARLIVENTLSVLAFELMAAAQGIDLREYSPSPVNEEIMKLIRSKVAFLEEDRELRVDIIEMNSLVRSGVIIKIVDKHCPEFE